MKRLTRATMIAVALPLAAALCGCSETTPMAEPEVLDSETETELRAQGDRRRSGPDTRSGGLGQEDLPAPSALGERWTYRVDEGDPEEGYEGSGEPAIARDPQSVLDAITPLGCRPGALPAPQLALEVTYQRGAHQHGVPGVGLVLQFASAVEAQRFFSVHTDVLTSCSASSRVDLEVLTLTPDTLVSTRTEALGHTPTWVEGVRLSDQEVTLIAVADGSAAGVRSVASALDAMAGSPSP